MKQKILKAKDFLFFYQLVVHIYNIEKSGMRGDKRLHYCLKVEEWSNLYVYQIGLGGSYGYEFQNVSVKETLNYDGCIVKYGV